MLTGALGPAVNRSHEKREAAAGTDTQAFAPGLIVDRNEAAVVRLGTPAATPTNSFAFPLP